MFLKVVKVAFGDDTDSRASMGSLLSTPDLILLFICGIYSIRISSTLQCIVRTDGGQSQRIIVCIGNSFIAGLYRRTDRPCDVSYLPWGVALQG